MTPATAQLLAAWSIAIMGIALATKDIKWEASPITFDIGDLVIGTILIALGYRIGRGNTREAQHAQGCLKVMLFLCFLGGLIWAFHRANPDSGIQTNANPWVIVAVSAWLLCTILLLRKRLRPESS